VAPRLGVPFVSTLHVIEDDVGGVRRFKRWAGVRARRRAALTIAVSDAVRDWYLSMAGASPQRVVTLRNGVADPGVASEEVRTRKRSALGLGPDDVAAVTLAVLRPGKGIDDLLEAAARMGGTSPVRFVVAGAGPEEKELISRAADLGVLDGRVQFLGFVDDVAGLLAGADLLVHPSHRDALPTAVIHAMAAGVPAVATTVGGTGEVVTDDTGLLIPPNDPLALLAAIEVVAADPDRRRWMGKRARERFEQEFSVAIWAQRLRDHYESVL
jgi:glycosyltransferase involved in cell wall biosynthesis